MNEEKFQIELLDSLPLEIEDILSKGHAQDEKATQILYNFKKFSLIIKNKEGEVIGILQAYTVFAEIYIDDVWVKKEYRGHGYGRRLLQEVEDRFRGQGYNNINLVTSHFQAPGFYEKCGFEKEFVRENKKNPRLSKTFFVKYFNEQKESQGVL